MQERLTEEQQAVVDLRRQSGNPVAIVTAYAGCGKTSTLRAYGERHTDERILYVAFNRGVADEAASTFPKNVQCRTVHALARRALGDVGEVRELSLRELASFLRTEPLEAAAARATLQAWFASSDAEIGIRHADAWVRQSSGEAAALRRKKSGAAVSLAKRLWEAMRDRKIPVTHDGYLKRFALEDPTLPWSVILLDEAQDTTPCVWRMLLAASRKAGSQLILVGDPHQSIYGWRGAKDAIGSALEEPHVMRELSHSFRLTADTADLASALLRNAKGIDVRIRGLGRGPSQGPDGPVAVISRTNAALIAEALHTPAKIHWQGTVERNGWDPAYLYDFRTIQDVFSLFTGSPVTRTDSPAYGYPSYGDLLAFVAATEGIGSGDMEIRFAVKCVEEYRFHTPKVLQRLRAAAVGPEECGAVFSTAHKAKGLEWDRVRLLEDFPTPKDLAASDGVDATQEINLLYVAATRSLGDVEPCAALQDWLEGPVAREDDLEAAARSR